MRLSPAVWSAVAASFAALSAFLTLRIHHRNFAESIRPELVLDDWHRVADNPETLRLLRVRNVGRGPAFDVRVASIHIRSNDNRGQATMAALMLPLVAANEAVGLEHDIEIYWNNVEPRVDDYRTLEATIMITCSDRRARRYRYEYLLSFHSPHRVATAFHVVLPGVVLARRRVRSVPGWQIGFVRGIAGLPLVGERARRWIRAWGA